MRKKILLFCIFLALIFSLFSMSVVNLSASESVGYSIDSGNVDVVLSADGSATVTEVWEFTSDTELKNTFSRDLAVMLEKEEEFDVRNVSANLDGEDLTFTFIDNIYDKTFSTEKVDGNVEIIAYEDSIPVGKHTYTVVYTLDNAVKKVDGNYYIFSHRFISKNLPDAVDDLKITVSTDFPADFSNVFYTSGTVSVSDGKLLYEDKNVNEKYKIKVRFDNAEFENAEEIKSSDLIKDDNTVMIVLISVLSALLVGVIVVIIILSVKMKKK